MGNKRELDAQEIRDLFNPKKNKLFLFTKITKKIKPLHCRRPGRVKQYTEEEIFLFKMRKHGWIKES